jgi:hypothetical protein
MIADDFETPNAKIQAPEKRQAPLRGMTNNEWFDRSVSLARRRIFSPP